MPKSGQNSGDEQEIVRKAVEPVPELEAEAKEVEKPEAKEVEKPEAKEAEKPEAVKEEVAVKDVAVEEDKEEKDQGEKGKGEEGKDEKDQGEKGKGEKGKKRERKAAPQNPRGGVTYVPKGSNLEAEGAKEAKSGEEGREEKKKREPKARKPARGEDVYVRKGEAQEEEAKPEKAPREPRAEGKVGQGEKGRKKPRRDRPEGEEREGDRRTNWAPKGEARRDQEGQRRDPEGQRRDQYRPKEEVKPANVGFEYPVGWREEAKKEVTVDTKIPENPAGEALLAEPSATLLEEEQAKINQKIRDLQKEQREKAKEQREVGAQIANKNSALIAQIKEKRREADKGFFEPLKKLKAEKQKLLDQKKALSDEIEKIKSKFGSKGLSKGHLTAQLRELEEEHETTQLSAHLESKLLERIEKVKDQFALIAPFDEKIKREKALQDKVRKMNEEMDAIFKNSKPVSDELAQLRKQLDQTNSESKKEEEGAKGEKKARQRSEKELELEEQIKGLKEQVKELIQKQKDLDKKFDADLLAFDVQQFEIRKLEEMRRFQTYLRRQEQRKKDDEEFAKRRQEQQEKELEGLKFSYHSEISECGTLIRLIEEKLGEKTQKPESTEEAPSQEGPKAPAVEDPDLKPFVGKKVDYRAEEARTVSKKAAPKKKVVEPKRFFSDYSAITLFSKYDIIMPNNPTEAENTLRLLKDKVEYFEAQRAKDIQAAEKRVQQGHGRREEPEAPRAPKDEPAKPKRRPQRPHNETDFPEL